MKVCILIPGNMTGGGVKVPVRLASHLVEWHKVTLIYPYVQQYFLNNLIHKSSFRKRTSSLLSGLRQIGKPFVLSADLDERVQVKKYFTLLHERDLQECDIIIYHSVWQYHELARLSLPHARKIHWSLADYLFCAGIDQPLNRILSAYGSEDILIAPSLAVKSLLESYGFRVYKTIPGGIDPIFNPEGRRPQSGSPTILGYFQPSWWVKGAATLIQVMRQIRVKYPNIKITLFGHQNSSIERTGSLICDKFYTGLSSAQVAALCRENDIFVYPGYSDGFQAPPLEAMASGCAVVLTNVGAAMEYAEHEKNALLCNPMDAQAMYLAVERLISDASLRQRLGRQAPRDSAKWSWRNCAEKFHQLITDLV